MNTIASTRLLVAVTVIGVAFGTIAVYINLKPAFAQERDDTAEMDARIIALHEQKINLLEKAVADLEDSAHEGRISYSSLIPVEVVLAEARIELAVMQDRRDTIAEHLRAILGLHGRALKDERIKLELGRGSPRDLLEQELAVIDTRVRILQVEANDD